MEVLMHQGNCEYMTLYHRVIDSFFLSNTHFHLNLYDADLLYILARISH